MLGPEGGLLQPQGALVIPGRGLILARLRRIITEVAQQFDEAWLIAAFLGQPHGIVAAAQRIGNSIGGLGGFEILIRPQQVGGLRPGCRRRDEQQGEDQAPPPGQRCRPAPGRPKHWIDAKLKHEFFDRIECAYDFFNSTSSLGDSLCDNAVGPGYRLLLIGFAERPVYNQMRVSHHPRGPKPVSHLERVPSPAALLLCLLIGHAAAARNVALLVAVGQFRDPALKTHQLLGPSLDIDSMQRALAEHWGFQPGDVVALRDQDATRDHILDQIAALEQRSAPGDTVLIYFSGHGTSANDNENAFDLPYATGAWVPYDLDYSSTAAAQRTLIVGRRDLVPRLKRLDQGGRWVGVVSDSCYSGQVVRSFGQSFSRSRFLPVNFRDLGVAHVDAVVSARPQPPPSPYQHVVLLSGASDSETGADISTLQALQQAPTLDGKFHGAFTDAFLRLLDGQLLSGAFNYAQGREALNTFLEHRNFAQHPQLLPGIAEDPQDVGSGPFSEVALPAAPGAIAPVRAGRDAALHLKFESVSAALKTKIAGLTGIAIVEREGDLTLRQRGDQA